MLKACLKQFAIVTHIKA